MLTSNTYLKKKLYKYPVYNFFGRLILSFLDAVFHLFLKRKERLPTTFKKILICNIAHLGDVVLTTSLLAPLKAAYPDTKIGILIGSWSKEVIEKHPLIHFVHVIDHWKINRKARGKFIAYWRSRKEALCELKKMGYDIAVDCNFHFPNMSVLLWQSKIPIRIGFKSAGLAPFLTHSFAWNPNENVSAVEAFFSLINGLFEVKRYKSLLRPHLACTAAKKEKYFVLHLGSGDAKKEWPLKNWQDLAEKLISDGFTLLFTGKGPRENTQITNVIRNLPNAINLCDQLSWQEFVSVIQKAELLIGVDSAAGHVASCFDTESILIFPAIHPELVWKPFSKKSHVVRKPPNCSPCFTGCSSMHCIREISVEDVYTKIKKVLSGRVIN